MNVKRESIQWAFGNWPKGLLAKEIMRDHLKGVILEAQKGLTQIMMKALFGWDESQVDEIVKEVRNNASDPERHNYHQWTAQKLISDTAPDQSSEGMRDYPISLRVKVRMQILPSSRKNKSSAVINFQG